MTDTKSDEFIENLKSRPKHPGRRLPTRRPIDDKAPVTSGTEEKTENTAVSSVPVNETSKIKTATPTVDAVESKQPKTTTSAPADNSTDTILPTMMKVSKKEQPAPKANNAGNRSAAYLAFISFFSFPAAVATIIATNFGKIASFLAALSLPVAVGLVISIVIVGVLIAALTYSLVKASQSNAHKASENKPDTTNSKLGKVFGNKLAAPSAHQKDVAKPSKGYVASKHSAPLAPAVNADPAPVSPLSFRVR